jgi:PAS domain S-box-containing protein
MAVGVTSDIPGFYFSAPVYHDGRITGVAVGKALVSEASDNFSDEHVSKSMNVFLVTEDGVVIAGSNPAFMLKSLAPLSAKTSEKLQKSRQFSNRDIPSLNYRALWDHIGTGKHDESTTHTDTAASSERLAVFAPLSEQNWHVVVSEDAAVVQAYVNSQIKNLLFVGLGVWVLICVSSYGASRILARMIGNMSKTISMIGSGRHDLRLKPGGPRELKETCHEFNRMADKLAASHESLERQIAERTEQLRREKELSENIIETAKSLVVVLDRDAAVATFNRFAEELTGYSRKEALGKNWLEMFIPQHDRGRIRQVFQNCLDGDLPENVENPIICKSGEERTILWSNSVLRDERGNITGTLSLGSDVSERRRAEETAKKEAAKLAAMISGMDEGVVFADAENAIVEVNDYFCRFVGKERDAIVGKKIEELHTGKALEHILDQVARFRGNPDSEPYVLQRSLGGAEVILRVQPIYHENCYEGVLLNVINVTELIQARRQAEAASQELEKRVRELEESRTAVLNMMEDMEEANRVLKETQAQLIQQEKMSSIGTLAAGVAHEFNNILTGIMGFASLARADKSKVPRLAEIVLRETERAATITRSLLSFSKQKEQSLASAGPRSLVEEVLTLVWRDFEKAGITIETRYGETPPVLVEAGRIEQVLLNLFINALHAMKRGGKLTVAVARDGNEVTFRISDTGCGILEENLSKIFDPFFSTKGVWGKDKQAGTGLGLSVSRNIIEAHKGKIDVESKVGVGSTFTVRLPAAEETEGVNQVQLTRKFMHEAKDSYRVLVADDEEMLRNLLVEILDSLGHEAAVVSSGEAAIEELQKTQYDYLFLDIMMPGRYDGATVLEKIEEMGSDVKVFVCTGKVEDENLLGLLEKAHGYVRKPFTMNEIASSLGAKVEEEEAAAGKSDA